jgi:hypothetical protein
MVIINFAHRRFAGHLVAIKMRWSEGNGERVNTGGECVINRRWWVWRHLVCVCACAWACTGPIKRIDIDTELNKLLNDTEHSFIFYRVTVEKLIYIHVYIYIYIMYPYIHVYTYPRDTALIFFFSSRSSLFANRSSRQWFARPVSGLLIPLTSLSSVNDHPLSLISLDDDRYSRRSKLSPSPRSPRNNVYIYIYIYISFSSEDVRRRRAHLMIRCDRVSDFARSADRKMRDTHPPHWDRVLQLNSTGAGCTHIICGPHERRHICKSFIKK